MKDEQKVWIRGVESRGSEVIKMLEDRGGKNRRGWKGNEEKLIFFIDHGGYIESTGLDSEFGKIIMDNYRELCLPEKWKDGDVLICRDCKLYAVFSHIDVKSSFVAYMQASKDGEQEYETGVQCNREDYLLATPSEVEHFHELLHKHGKEWDAEKKQVVSWRWKPKINETYWFITGSNTIMRSVWADTFLDNEYFKFGNCFRTREEAEAAAERVKKALKGE